MTTTIHWLCYLIVHLCVAVISLIGLGLWCLTPLSAIFQLYRGSHFFETVWSFQLEWLWTVFFIVCLFCLATGDIDRYQKGVGCWDQTHFPVCPRHIFISVKIDNECIYRQASVVINFIKGVSYCCGLLYCQRLE